MDSHFLPRRNEQAILLLRGEPERGRGEGLDVEGGQAREKKERKCGEGNEKGTGGEMGEWGWGMCVFVL